MAEPGPSTYKTASYSGAALYCSIDKDAVADGFTAKEEGAKQVTADVVERDVASSITTATPHWTHESFKYSAMQSPAMVYFASIEDDLQKLADSTPPEKPAAFKEEQEHNDVSQENDIVAPILVRRKRQVLQSSKRKSTCAIGVYPKMMRNKQTARKPAQIAKTVKGLQGAQDCHERLYEPQ